jgi:hypothetical protein
MGLSESLQLVFLNGCATSGQVRTLLDRGVKAVIATAVPINDGMATEFAEQFYQALGSGRPIKQAFDTARAMIASRYDGAREIGEFRGLHFASDASPVSAALTWGLYLHPDADGQLAWKLPERAENQVLIRGGASAVRAEAPANETLIEILCNAVAPYSLELSTLLEIARRTNRPDLRMVRQQIIDAFPAPVGEQLRKLLAGNDTGTARLRQLVITYETVAKLFCFTLMSQLWNALYDNAGMIVSGEQWDAIEAFKRLDATQAPTFDYLSLIITIDAVLQANGTAPFMEECSSLQQQLSDEDTKAAHLFMEQQRARLAGGTEPDVDAKEVESLCVQGERHLATLLADLAFMVRYKLATIKGISIRKTRHKPPEFRHRQVLLDRATTPYVDIEEVRASYTDNESVILLKDPEDVSQYLNLTPFVIDENALTGHENTKIYFYSHYDQASDAYHYYSIADPLDRLAISEEIDPDFRDIYVPIKGLLEEFCSTVARP